MMARTSRHLEKSGRLEGGVDGDLFRNHSVTLDPHRKSRANHLIYPVLRAWETSGDDWVLYCDPEVFWVAEWTLWAESWRMAGTS